MRKHPGTLRCGARSLRRLLVLGACGWAAVAGAEVVAGVQLPDGARKVGENRYRIPKDFEDTLTYYRTVYPPASYPRKTIVNQQAVRAVHIAFPPGKGVDGLNVYEDKAALREVRIYIVPADAKKAPAANAVDKKRGNK
ncbi:MAG: hypothetical protein L0Y66_19045 [Myxococcaceae bacterium]|nr:hypothetical protein [Myxococcaceae bacterium]MCI0672240.1 hypothetical protein [Myxococcaceae bacterium]